MKFLMATSKIIPGFLSQGMSCTSSSSSSSPRLAGRLAGLASTNGWSFLLAGIVTPSITLLIVTFCSVIISYQTLYTMKNKSDISLQKKKAAASRQSLRVEVGSTERRGQLPPTQSLHPISAPGPPIISTKSSGIISLGSKYF